MTVVLGNFLTKLPYTHRKYMVLANPKHNVVVASPESAIHSAWVCWLGISCTAAEAVSLLQRVLLLQSLESSLYYMPTWENRLNLSWKEAQMSTRLHLPKLFLLYDFGTCVRHTPTHMWSIHLHMCKFSTYTRVWSLHLHMCKFSTYTRDQSARTYMTSQHIHAWPVNTAIHPLK
jgi:hypothetical protein